jgi:hypothetical protein
VEGGVPQIDGVQLAGDVDSHGRRWRQQIDSLRAVI